MINKRNIQHFLRRARHLIKGEGWKNRYFENILADLDVANPPPFNKAIFNFTIDFELYWGNGNQGGYDYSIGKRIEFAKIQNDNFPGFIKLFSELQFPHTWAILGILAKRVMPPPNLKFAPLWSKVDWYRPPRALDQEGSIWNGQKYLEEIKKLGEIKEVLSHTYIHADFSDSDMTEEKADWDIKTSMDSLREVGLDPKGLVYPCNKHNFYNLLSKNNIQIIRGERAQKWGTPLPGILSTPLGFWITPGRLSLDEAKRIIDVGIEKRSFIHPWMHLIESDLNSDDLNNFYRPLFEYVLKRAKQGDLEILSFDEIRNRYFKYKSKM